MGTWSSFSSALAHVQSQYESCKNSFDANQAQVGWAWDDWFIPDDHAALAHCINAANMAGWAALRASTIHTDLTDNFAVHYCLDDLDGRINGADVSMDAILSAMLSADPSQVEYFVGLVDAYRQSIWNRPFNKDFFAALARGFMIWP